MPTQYVALALIGCHAWTYISAHGGYLDFKFSIVIVSVGLDSLAQPGKGNMQN